MLRPVFVTLLIVVSFALAGCATFPELEGAPGKRALKAEYPRLLPFEAILGQVGGRIDRQAPGAGLGNRAATLRRRAAALQGPILDTATRQRLMAAVARHQ